LDIIINPKVTEKGEAVIQVSRALAVSSFYWRGNQLETAAGAAIRHFKNAYGINVPRSRFLPVKNCSDLLLIKSDIYAIENAELVISPERMFATTPIIQLGDHFKKVAPVDNFFASTSRLFCVDSGISETIQEDP
jgi:UTP--glucose-1-phosphate uridylyltransferase